MRAVTRGCINDHLSSRFGVLSIMSTVTHCQRVTNIFIPKRLKDELVSQCREAEMRLRELELGSQSNMDLTGSIHRFDSRRLDEREVELNQLRISLDQRKAQLDQREEEEIQEFDEARRKMMEREVHFRQEMTEKQEQWLHDKGVSETLREKLRVEERMHDSMQAHLSEFRGMRKRLMWWEAPAEELACCSTIGEVAVWENEITEEFQRVLGRLADRRVELKVAAALRSFDPTLCKICFDQQSSCALMPCRHHAFCTECATNIFRAQKPCPLCRREVTGIFETYAG